MFPFFSFRFQTRTNNRFDEDTNTVDQDYPRDIKGFWKGIPYHIDAAFQYTDGMFRVEEWIINNKNHTKKEEKIWISKRFVIFVAGKTYFFKGKSYWQFNDLATRVTSVKSESSAVRWMGCPPLKNSLSNEVYIDFDTHHERHTAALSSASKVFIDCWVAISCWIFVKLLK